MHISVLEDSLKFQGLNLESTKTIFKVNTPDEESLLSVIKSDVTWHGGLPNKIMSQIVGSVIL